MGPKKSPTTAPGQCSLGGSLADHVSLVVQIDVAAAERATHDDPVVPVMLENAIS